MSELTFRQLLKLSAKELTRKFANGVQPELESLEGWEFIGVNISKAAKFFGIPKFQKGFFRTSDTPPGQLFGYNVLVYPDGLDMPHRAFPSEINPIRHGYYLVRPVGPDDGTLSVFPHALLLDYSRGPKNPPWYPGNVLRDLIVQVDPENPHLLLGRAYISIAGKLLFSNYFVLQRSNANYRMT